MGHGYGFAVDSVKHKAGRQPISYIFIIQFQFNGDPTKVTVMGESAGGAASSLLALSPKTSGISDIWNSSIFVILRVFFLSFRLMNGGGGGV